MADDIRLEILHLLQEGELCACRIQDQFHISQPTLSYHMKILTQCGLVNSRKDGLWMRYSLNPGNFALTRDLLSRFCESFSQESFCSCTDEKNCPVPVSAGKEKK